LGAALTVRVDEDRCQGHNLCSIAAPTVFKLRDDDGHAYVEDEDVPAGMEQRVRNAAASCPEAAIIVGERADRSAGSGNEDDVTGA
jgi:ferredoxin